MLPIFTITIVFIVIIALWIIYIQRKLVVLDEDITNAMSQIGVLMSSRFDVLMALIDLTKGYVGNESEILFETIKCRRCIITAKSTPDEVLRQEGIITEVLDKIAEYTKQFPKMRYNQNYIRTKNAVDIYESMERTGRLIYNDCVTKLNRELRMFPVSVVAGRLGFSRREYLANQVNCDVHPSGEQKVEYKIY
jgi:LemA protein